MCRKMAQVNQTSAHPARDHPSASLRGVPAERPQGARTGRDHPSASLRGVRAECPLLEPFGRDHPSASLRGVRAVRPQYARHRQPPTIARSAHPSHIIAIRSNARTDRKGGDALSRPRQRDAKRLYGGGSRFWLFEACAKRNYRERRGSGL